MSLFFSFFKLAFKEKYTYRFNFYVSIISSMLVLFIQVNVWQALYNNQTSIDGVTLNQMIIYILISTIIVRLTQSTAVNQIGSKIETGAIISDFMKPVNFKSYILAEDLANNFFRLIFTSLPISLVAFLIFDIKISSSFLTILLTIISVIFGVLIAFYIYYIFALTVFWLETSWYIPFLITATFTLFSGSQIPIWFYPSWLEQLTLILPFRFTIFEPISIFLGRYTFTESLYVFFYQLCWLGGLYIIERLLWLRVQNKIVIHGG